jgi:hypothetical protein
MSELHWIHEPALKATDEEGQIYEAVIGKHPGYLVAIYNGAVIDPEATERDGRARYRNAPMVCVRQHGEKDFTSEPLRDEHKQRFPRTWAWWQKHQADARKVSVSLLPGITPAEIAELRDLGVTDADALCSTEVPENLQPLRAMALRLRTLSKPRLRLVDGQMQEVA